ncbi:Ldh family oxidoreductase [Cupriavidus basilensis]
MNFDASDLLAWCGKAFEIAGLPREDAADAAALLVRTDMRGIPTHGMTRLPQYLSRLRSGENKARPDIRVSAERLRLIVDADRALGQVAGKRALEAALPLLQDNPMVACAIRHCGHLGALGLYALLAAEQGAFAVVVQRTPALISMPGQGRPVIGNNPIAFACPVPDRPPVVFDMACSVAARGQILLAHRDGRSLPEHWALDRDGMPTTDAAAALAGALLPAAGAKGLGMAMLVECLAGAMSGALACGPGADEVDEQAAVLLLFSPTLWVESGAFEHGMRRWTSAFCGSGTPGKPGIRLPGSRGAALEAQCLREGLALDDRLLAQLQEVSNDIGIALPPPIRGPGH